MTYRKTMDYFEKQNEDSFELFNNSMLAGALKVLYVPDMTILWANDYFFEMLGYTRDEYYGVYQNKLAPVIYKEDLFMLMVGASRWFDETNRNLMNIRYVHKSGKTIWVKISSLLTDEYVNDLPVIYNIVTDITVLKEYELTLNRQAGFYKSLIDSSLIGVFQFQEGKRPKIIYSNDIAFHVLGYTREEFQKIHGNYMYAIIYQEDLEKVIKIQNELMLNGKSTLCEFRAERKNGEIIWLLACGRRCINQSGISVFQCEFMEITSLKKAQQEKENKTGQLNTIYEGIPIGICRYELDESIIMRYSNEEGCRLLGIGSIGHLSEEINVEIEKYLLPVEYKKLYVATQEAAAKKQPVNVDIKLSDNSGKNRWINIHATLSTVDGIRTIFHAAVTDITKYMINSK